MTRPSLHQLASGLAAYDPDALPVPTAQHLIRASIEPIEDTERLALRDALGRVLAEDVISPIDVPAHDNSAMDGYALAGATLLPGQTHTLNVIGTAYAGHPFASAPNNGECVRIMTGAVMPPGCDTVVPQELVTAPAPGQASFAGDAVPAGANRRRAGEDLQAGRAALPAGHMLRPAELGLLASLGIGEVLVRRRLRVAFFSTGDELRSIGEPLDAGCIYDSNRYTLFGMLTRLGCEVIDLGVVKDDPQSLEAALRHACAHADAVLTSGGVSVGDADYTRDLLARLGEVAFWKIAMRPGRPLAFGRLEHGGKHAWLFALPGNPVATMVAFYVFVRDALLAMSGTDRPLPRITVRSAAAIRKRPGRTEYQRGIVAAGVDGQPVVRLTGAQGSGILRSMAEANCLVVLHADQGDVAAGEMVDVLLFEGLV